MQMAKLSSRAEEGSWLAVSTAFSLPLDTVAENLHSKLIAVSINPEGWLCMLRDTAYFSHLEASENRDGSLD